MGSITTAMADSFKVELMQGGHCFNTTVNPTGTGSSGATTLTLSAVTGISVGMIASGTGLASGTAVASIPSSTLVLVAPAATAAVSGTLTFTGDTFKMALIQATPTGSYLSSNASNYTLITGNSDEVSGTGYTTGGQALTNVGASASGSPVQAVINFSPGPSWTTATFSTSGCMIYNSTARVAGTTGRGCGVFSFGGVQTVTSGTFSVVMPAASSATAILRVA